EMDQWRQACLDAATWTMTCGATAQNVMDLQNLCNFGYYPSVLDCMINAHEVGGCIDFYRCFTPSDAGACTDMCNFWNTTCMFGAGANCLANCQANPWPQLIVDCATS